MIRSIAAAAGVLLALVMGPIPWATADPATPYVVTQSGFARCVVTSDRVACQADFRPAPGCNNPPADCNVASIEANGAFGYSTGNIGGATGDPSQPPDTVLTYGRTFDIAGWTILPNTGGTRFTNDRTGSGMFVSKDDVYGF